MKEKSSKDVVEEVATTPAAAPAKAEEEHCYVYLGPTRYPLIQSGSIFVAKSVDDIPEIAQAVEKIPQVKQLIVLDTDIRAVKNKLNEGKNAVSNAYKAIEEAEI